jgi:hypothetical protein
MFRFDVVVHVMAQDCALACRGYECDLLWFGVGVAWWADGGAKRWVHMHDTHTQMQIGLVLLLCMFRYTNEVCKGSSRIKWWKALCTTLGLLRFKPAKPDHLEGNMPILEHMCRVLHAYSC